MGSVETQEHPPAKPHGPAHTDTQGAERLGRGFWSRPQQMYITRPGNSLNKRLAETDIMARSNNN